MTQKPKILVVEDEVELAGVLKYLIEQEGMLVDVEYNGESALRYLEGNTPDMLVLDIMLPQMDGFSVCNYIRQSAKNVPVLILSAKAQSEDVIKGLELGADDYMTKPFNNNELILRIKKIGMPYFKVETFLTNKKG